MEKGGPKRDGDGGLKRLSTVPMEEPSAKRISTEEAKPPNIPRRTFADLKISRTLVERCKDMGLTCPTEVQAACIPHIFAGTHVIATSPTGSGKTLTFALPMVHQWSQDPFGIFGLILTPTRELAQQIKEQFEALVGPGLRVCLIIGGTDFQLQAVALGERPHFIVATPGRLADHISSDGRSLFRRLKYLVIDEADRILGGDFTEQICTIIAAIPRTVQNLFFTATITDTVLEIGENFEVEPFIYNYMKGRESESILAGRNLNQKYVFCPGTYKDGYFMELLRMIQAKEFEENISSMIVFASTIKDCQVLGIAMKELGFENVVLHSHTNQKSRLQALSTFKSGQVNCLIGTDVASRGLDIKQVDLVINYSVPFPQDYVHRVGRAGRTGKIGTAVSFITPRDAEFITKVEEFVGEKMTEIKISESDVLKILTHVNTTKRAAALAVEENDKYEERAQINERKKELLQQNSTDSGEGDSDSAEDSPAQAEITSKE